MDECWVIGYEGFNPKQEGLREALCTLGNGRFATRGRPRNRSPTASTTPEPTWPGSTTV